MYVRTGRLSGGSPVQDASIQQPKSSGGRRGHATSPKREFEKRKQARGGKPSAAGEAPQKRRGAGARGGRKSNLVIASISNAINQGRGEIDALRERLADIEEKQKAPTVAEPKRAPGLDYYPERPAREGPEADGDGEDGGEGPGPAAPLIGDWWQLPEHADFATQVRGWKFAWYDRQPNGKQWKRFLIEKMWECFYLFLMVLMIFVFVQVHYAEEITADDPSVDKAHLTWLDRETMTLKKEPCPQIHLGWAYWSMTPQAFWWTFMFFVTACCLWAHFFDWDLPDYGIKHSFNFEGFCPTDGRNDVRAGALKNVDLAHSARPIWMRYVKTVDGSVKINHEFVMSASMFEEISCHKFFTPGADYDDVKERIVRAMKINGSVNIDRRDVYCNVNAAQKAAIVAANWCRSLQQDDDLLPF